jgi:hypothetical protein
MLLSKQRTPFGAERRRFFRLSGEVLNVGAGVRQRGMPARYVTVDREAPMLLLPDLRDWVPADDLVHFVIDAIEELDVRMARVNEQGSGSEQYSPASARSVCISAFLAYKIYAS